MPSPPPLPHHPAFPRAEHLPDLLPADPFPIFTTWLDEALARKDGPNPNAMTLATIDPDGRPSARIVLCKGVDSARGFIVFYTNHHGRKGRALAANPRAALVFYWDHADRQVRIEGPVLRSPDAESDAYFASRPVLSRVGGWASAQSEPIASRAELRSRMDATLERFHIDSDGRPIEGNEVHIPRPPHWGGFRVWAERVELWCGASSRLHDRAEWTRTVTTAPGASAAPESDNPQTGPWRCTRLQP